MRLLEFPELKLKSEERFGAVLMAGPGKVLKLR